MPHGKGTYGPKVGRPKMTPKKKTSKKIKGADGKACWKGYSYAGTKNGKDKCVKTKK